MCVGGLKKVVLPFLTDQDQLRHAPTPLLRRGGLSRDERRRHRSLRDDLVNYLQTPCFDYTADRDSLGVEQHKWSSGRGREDGLEMDDMYGEVDFITSIPSTRQRQKCAYNHILVIKY